MSIPEVGKKIRVTVPSTTANLGPGFDCLGAALDLYNEFIFTRIEGGGDRFDLIMESTDGNHLRGGPENLVFRAAQKVWGAQILILLHLKQELSSQCRLHGVLELVLQQ